MRTAEGSRRRINGLETHSQRSGDAKYSWACAQMNETVVAKMPIGELAARRHIHAGVRGEENIHDGVRGEENRTLRLSHSLSFQTASLRQPHVLDVFTVFQFALRDELNVFLRGMFGVFWLRTRPHSSSGLWGK